MQLEKEDLSNNIMLPREIDSLARLLISLDVLVLDRSCMMRTRARRRRRCLMLCNEAGRSAASDHLNGRWDTKIRYRKM